MIGSPGPRQKSMGTARGVTSGGMAKCEDGVGAPVGLTTGGVPYLAEKLDISWVGLLVAGTEWQ